MRKIFAGRKIFEVTGVGYEPVGELKGSDGIRPTEYEPVRQLLLGGILCNDAAVERRRARVVRGDTTEGALIVAAVKAGLHEREIRLENVRLEEIPFSSERKRMTTVHEMADGKRVAFTKGAPGNDFAEMQPLSGRNRNRGAGRGGKADGP